ncbi:MAG: hypothetical protein C4542_09615 [Dehalococcoidia bacterium]|nr:MAG: hypothetical protein C4542_09615 [Dehalococcoidia bacterium]
MMLLRRPGAANAELLLQLITEVTADATDQELAAHVQAGTWPEGFIERALRYIDDNPSLIGVSDREFYAALQVVRPDLGEVLATPAGQKWVERVGTRLALGLPMRWLGLGR